MSEGTAFSPFNQFIRSLIGKEHDIMLKINYMSTLFVGIDVSSMSNMITLWTMMRINSFLPLSVTIVLVPMPLA